MSKESNQTNSANGDKVAGTGLKTLTPKPYKGVAKHSSVNGVSGENADSGNRNKKS